MIEHVHFVQLQTVFIHHDVAIEASIAFQSLIVLTKNKYVVLGVSTNKEVNDIQYEGFSIRVNCCTVQYYVVLTSVAPFLVPK